MNIFIKCKEQLLVKLSQIICDFKRSPIALWLIIFVLMSLIVRGTGGTNAASRYATMRAMHEQLTFKIDSYKEWTVDWAKTPDGHFYSNKAPGPMLFGFPIFAPLDRLSFFKKNSPVDTQGHHIDSPSAAYKIIFNLIFQVLPFAICVLIISMGLCKSDHKKLDLHWLALALLFGQSAALFMNSNFGHGIAAIFFLMLIKSIYDQDYTKSGFYFGSTLLCDYAAAVTLPIFLVINARVFLKEKVKLLSFVKGGIIPGVLWIWYHWVCFGSPFTIAHKYQNQSFIQQADNAEKLWGALALPDINIMTELLIGLKRGLLFTQPWVLIALILPFIYWRYFTNKQKPVIFVVLATFLAVFFINSSFNGWHGGMSPGPRYLSFAIPPLAILVYWSFPYTHKVTKLLLWLGLIISLIFRAQVYGTGNLVPVRPIWNWQWEQILAIDGGKMMTKMIVFYCMLLIGALISFKKLKKS